MSAIRATRRTLLIGTASTAAVVAIPAIHAATEHPDAALTSLCATFATACAELQRLNAMEDPTDDQLDAAVEAWNAPIDTIITTRASTPAGIRAKAKAMIGIFANGGVSKYRWETVEQAMTYHEKAAWALAHDILAMGSSGT